MSGHVFNIPRVGGDGSAPRLNQSSRRSGVASHGCCISDKRATLRSLRLRSIVGTKFAERHQGGGGDGVYRTIVAF